MKIVAGAFALLLFSFLASDAFAGESLKVMRGLVLKHVTVVNVRDGSLSKDMTVVVDGGKIVHVLPASNVAVAASARVVDGRGKFVVPGYLDMHTHALTHGGRIGNLKMMLAYGITGFRQMSGDPELLAEFRDRQALFPGQPEILAMCGTIMNNQLFPTPEAAAAEVRKQKGEGADLIKEVGLWGEPFFAVLAEAGKEGLPVSGHLHPSIDVRKAARAGLTSIEHMGAGAGIFVGCSSEEAALLSAEVSIIPTSSASVGQNAPAMTPEQMEKMIERLIANPVMGGGRQGLDLTRRALETFDEAKCRELASEFAANETWQVPSLIRLRTMDFGDDPLYRDDPNLVHVPQENRRLWGELAEDFPKIVTERDREVLARFFALEMRTVKLFRDMGVPMMTGSDFGGQWLVPGYSLHQEFDLLSESGLAGLDILRMATLNGAKFLGKEETMGTVEGGKNADLVLLNGNPIADAANLHRIAGVVRAGIWFSGDDLRAVKESVIY